MSSENKLFNIPVPSHQHLTSENHKQSLKFTSQLEDPIRLAGIYLFISAIRAALQSLKSLNQKYIEHFELNSTWRKIYNALLTFNQQQQLSSLVNLKVCEAVGRQKSFFDPFSKSPVSICYNKINRYQNFQKQLLFNVIVSQKKSLFYITTIEPNLKQIGMKFSQLQSQSFEVYTYQVYAKKVNYKLKSDDKKCFEEEVKWRVLEKQRFQGMIINFDELYTKAVNDFEPISQVVSDTL